MTSHLDAGLHDARPAALVLPPAFRGLVATSSVEAHTQACRLAAAGKAEAGALLLAERDDRVDLAVVLAPDEPLATARRAIYAGMQALADAVGGFGPPQIPVLIRWTDTLTFNAARIGGGRLGWPPDCAEDAVPDWLVFSGQLIVSKAQAGDPGLTPDSTSLEEEGFPPALRAPLAESFARHLTKAFEIWSEDGFAPLAARCLGRLVLAPGERADIAPDGGLSVRHEDGRTEHLPLLPALRTPAWQDPATGTMRP